MRLLKRPEVEVRNRLKQIPHLRIDDAGSFPPRRAPRPEKRRLGRRRGSAMDRRSDRRARREGRMKNGPPKWWRRP